MPDSKDRHKIIGFILNASCLGHSKTLKSLYHIYFKKKYKWLILDNIAFEPTKSNEVTTKSRNVHLSKKLERKTILICVLLITWVSYALMILIL